MTLPEGSVFIEVDSGKVKRRTTGAWVETNTPGSNGSSPSNTDGGAPDSNFGGAIALDGGTP